MPLTPRRKGLYRVAGGLTWTTSHLSIILSVRPESGGWRIARELDFNGYRYLYLGRLLIAVAHAFTSRGQRRIARQAQAIVDDAVAPPSIAERISDYGYGAK